VRPKQLVDELGVHDRAGDEGRTVGHIRFVAAAEIVEDDEIVSGGKKMAGNVGADEPGAAGDQDGDRWVRLAARTRRAVSIG